MYIYKHMYKHMPIYVKYRSIEMFIVLATKFTDLGMRCATRCCLDSQVAHFSCSHLEHLVSKDLPGSILCIAPAIEHWLVSIRKAVLGNIPSRILAVAS